MLVNSFYYRLFNLCPFIALSVRNGQGVSFGSYVSWAENFWMVDIGINDFSSSPE